MGSWMSTYIPKAGELERKWFVIDAKDQVLGHLAARAASVLSGKLKPSYTPFLDTGDHVIILNADKIRLTGKKPEKKVYKRFSGYPGGQVEVPFATLFARHPEEVVRHAVKDMLPRSGLGRRMIFKLQVYKGSEHPHQAQQPKELKINA